VFAPCGLYDLRPRGGTVYAARRVPKLEQIERLARQGLPVPHTARLTRDIVLDPMLWGRHVVAKPQFGIGGANVRLLSVRDVVARYAELTDNDAREMLIQAYIEHSHEGLPTSYRVLTMFGTALYAMRNRWARPRAAIEEIVSDGKGVIASNSDEQGREQTLWNDPEIVALAERAHSAFPGFPVLGVDVLRDSETAKLYVVEVNPGGATWHFSSPVARAKQTPEFLRQRYQQFDGLERAARLLVDRTRAEAR
jgi:glutathione synthase/RimK-type ligase-like ATP-grasp enzyme